MMTADVVMLAASSNNEVHLTAAGAIIMTFSVLTVLGMMIFCMVHILREKRPAEHHHAPLDIDTEDLDS